jgi:hypothetical protein
MLQCVRPAPILLVYDAAKGSLPALVTHPPVDPNFKADWKHVSVSPRRHRSANPMGHRNDRLWPLRQVQIPLYLSTSHRLETDAPKDVYIEDCGRRVCGDYRLANDQLQKSFPSTANGTDELAKLPGYSYYWIADRFSMYNAYALRPGPHVNSSPYAPPLDS